MQDRVPLYPGRVKLNPVSGQANTFDLVRADQPTQEGTPLNKANLLKDATAELYGLPNTAVPDDVLSKIKTLIDSANANANTKARIATGSYTGTGTHGSSNPNRLTFEFAPKLVMVNDNSDNGFIAIRNCPKALLGGATGLPQKVTWDNNTVSWSYDGAYSSAYNQYNADGTIYNYVAIG